MAKHTRERIVKERRERKKEKKDGKKQAAALERGAQTESETALSPQEETLG